MRISLDLKPKKIYITDALTSKIIPCTKAGMERELRRSKTIYDIKTSYDKNCPGCLITNKFNENSIVKFYTLEKRRKVVKNKTLISDGVDKGKFKRVLVTPNHWIAYVYEVPLAFLKFANLKVTQGSRTFTITSI